MTSEIPLIFAILDSPIDLQLHTVKAGLVTRPFFNLSQTRWVACEFFARRAFFMDQPWHLIG